MEDLRISLMKYASILYKIKPPNLWQDPIVNAATLPI